MASEIELTDTEIDELVAAVSEEVGLTSNEDDVDFELEGDITVDVNLPSEMSAAECTVADEEVNNISIPTASNLDCQDTYTVTDPGSSDQQSHKETAAAANEADCQNNEYLSEMCPDSRDTNCNPQLVKSIPGKAIPVSFYGASAEQPVILDKTSKDLMSDPQDLLKVQSESEDLASSAVPVADCYAAAKKSENSQQSKKHKSPTSDKGWGWRSLGSWSSSVLSTASNFTSHVGESFVHVLETVEAGLIEPEDESLSKTADSCAEKNASGNSVGGECESNYQKHAKLSVNKDESDKASADAAAASADEGKDARRGSDTIGSRGWLPDWNLSSLTQLTGSVKNTGKKVVSTGLGVIGDIGKKTYNILIEDDEDSDAARKTNVRKTLSRLYQDDAGTAHLEALEELSRWSSDTLGKQLSCLKGKPSDAVHDDLALINESFHLGDFSDLMDATDKEHDFARLVTDFVSQLGLQLSVNKLIETQANTRKWLVEQSLKVPELQQLEPQEVYKSAIQSLLDLTSASVAVYHKVAQLLLIENSGNPLLSYKFRSLSLVGLTKVLCFELHIQSSQFAHLLLSDGKQSDVAKSLVKSIDLEASQSAKCLQTACSHLLPIMQLVVSKMHPSLSDHTAGVAHLEGLQVLSNISQNNVREALGQFEREARRNVETHLADIETLFDLGYLQADDESEQQHDTFNSRLMHLVQQLTTDTETAQKLTSVQQRIWKYLKDCERDQTLGHVQILTNDIHHMGVQSLTDWTAVSIELYYGIAQSLLLEQPCDISLYAHKAETLVSLTKLLCIEVGHISSQLTRCLSSAASLSDSVTPFVTNIYVEASSSSTCIQDGLHLLLPVVQLALVKAEPVVRQVSSSTPDQ